MADLGFEKEGGGGDSNPLGAGSFCTKIPDCSYFPHEIEMVQNGGGGTESLRTPLNLQLVVKLRMLTYKFCSCDISRRMYMAYVRHTDDYLQVRNSCVSTT